MLCDAEGRIGDPAPASPAHATAPAVCFVSTLNSGQARALVWAKWGSTKRIGRVAARSGVGLLFVFGRLKFATVHDHWLWHAINRDLVDSLGHTKDPPDRADCPGGQMRLRDAGSDALAFTKTLHSLRVTRRERHHGDCGETARSHALLWVAAYQDSAPSG